MLQCENCDRDTTNICMFFGFSRYYDVPQMFLEPGIVSFTYRTACFRFDSAWNCNNNSYLFVYSFTAYGSSKNWIEHYKSRPIH